MGKAKTGIDRLPKLFIEKIDFIPFHSCWEWSGAMCGKYGSCKYKGIPCESLAHRISWILFKGAISPGLKVCHLCDNPSCVNPGHLFLGSQSDNIMDAVRKKETKHVEKDPV